MCGAGDLQMINDFPQGELCPLPPMCGVITPPSPACLQREEEALRLGGEGRLEVEACDHKEHAAVRALCWEGGSVLAL